MKVLNCTHVKARFIEYMSEAHLDGFNAGLYERDDKSAFVKLEQVTKFRKIKQFNFTDIAEAKAWWAALPGRGAGKLANLLDAA